VDIGDCVDKELKEKWCDESEADIRGDIVGDDDRVAVCEGSERLSDE